LITVLADPNREKREQARRLLAQRPEPIGAALHELVAANAPSALEALWVLNLRHEIDEAGLRRVLAHPNEHLRRWAVRLLGDANLVQPATAAALARLAQTEPAVEVRSQLASSARRLPAGQAFPILRALLLRDEDAADLHLPLLIWWAIESKADTGREEILTLVGDPALWRAKMFSGHTAERIARRFTADQGPRRYYTLKQGVYSEWIVDRAPEHLRRNLEMCARLLEVAPASGRATLLSGLAQGLTGPRVESVPGAFEQIISQAWRTSPHSTDLVALAARIGLPEATGEALARVKDPKLKDADRQALIDLLAALPAPEALPVIGGLLQTEKNEARRASRLAALGGFPDVAAAEAVIAAYPSLSPRLQNTAQRMLSERPTWAMAMLQRMNLGTFKPGVLSSSNVALLRSHGDPRLTSLYTTYQQTHSDDPAQQAAQRLFETGRTAFNLTCAPCHQESGAGMPMLAPALIGSRWLQASEEQLVRIVLHGKENPGRGLIMPPWRQLEDGQIAAILTYVRREFGNQPVTVSAAQVAAIRAATRERQKAWTDAELDALRASGK
jgi:mono/diheme cytochrome c family protein